MMRAHASAYAAKRGVAALAVAVAMALTATGSARGKPPSAKLGPKPGKVAVRSGASAVTLRIAPNSSQRWNTVTVTPTTRGKAVRRGNVHISFAMVGMDMGTQRYRMKELRPGVYRYEGPGVLMNGIWTIHVEVAPHGGRAFAADVRDDVRG